MTGHTLGAELARRIFRPLHLADTSYPTTRTQLPSPYAHGYFLLGKPPLVDLSGLSPSLSGPAGAIVSTVDDIAGFYRALLTGRLLEPAQLDAMKTTLPTGAELKQRYGLGLERYATACGSAWGHSGSFPGYWTYALASANGEQEVVVMVNIDPSAAPAPAQRALHQAAVHRLLQHRANAMRRHALIVGVAGLTTAAALATVASAGGAGPSAARASALAWKQCNHAPKFQCGSIRLPVDWAKPAGPKLTVRMARRPADDPSMRIGTLFFQPGGPGDGGISYVTEAADLVFSPALRARFDIIGVDPRGFGESTPVSCGVPLTVPGVTLFPRTPLEFQHMVSHNRAVGASCLKETGPSPRSRRRGECRARPRGDPGSPR